ncbi:MAG: NAD(P)(+) transhydrogenase (Re/Si-specific) subunit beta, partial [Maritimibacter sp.]
MTPELQTSAYIAATVLFILSLGGLKNQESAKRAVWFGIVGMGIAVLATVLDSRVPIDAILLVTLAIGAVIGAIVAMRVEMTGMPQLVAALHSFVGLAAVFIGINSDLTVHEFA